MRWFQFMATIVTCAFFGMLILVTLVAYVRKSGNTGVDVAKVQKIRTESLNR